MRTFGFTLLVFVICASIAIAQGDLEVVKPVAPEKYSAAARAVHAHGRVSVEVKVGEDGRVLSASVIEGHTLLRASSLEAAKKWEFTASSLQDARPRTANLFFDFGFGDKEHIRRIASSEMGITHGARASFPLPFTVELIYEAIVPDLLLLKRKDGRIIPESCALHEVPLEVEVQRPCDKDPERAGYLREIFSTSEFDEAVSNLFPKAKFETYRSTCDDLSILYAEVHYCEKCRAAGEAWLRENDK